MTNCGGIVNGQRVGCGVSLGALSVMATYRISPHKKKRIELCSKCAEIKSGKRNYRGQLIKEG